MRRLLIRRLLPITFTLLPAWVAVAIVAVVPPAAREFYVKHLRTSGIDWLILGLGSVLFLAQARLTARALTWQGRGFDERADPWLSHLAQAAEWFPLLGLLGTVSGILQTFSAINGPIAPQQIIQLYAPAVTATGSGLFMALINILPTWVVLVGRDLILGLAGTPAPMAEARP